MSARDIILIIVVLLVIGALPIYPYSANFGYFPVGIFVVILIILLLFRFL